MRYFNAVKKNWGSAWSNQLFRLNLIVGVVILISILTFTSFFFDYVENCPGGVVINDWVLKKLPSMDVSLPIVVFESSSVVLFLMRSTTNPLMCIKFLIAFLLVVTFRIITIGLTQFNAPIGLIDLQDPIGSAVYRSGFVERDLFYSGHTAILFLIFLCSVKALDKYYVLFATVIVGILLLIQHVHYTVDVVSAPFFAFVSFSLSKKWLNFQGIVMD